MLFKNVLITFGGNFIILVVNFATGVVLARLLGPLQRGELAAIQTFPNVLSVLMLVGLPQAFVYWISKESQRSKEIVTTTLFLFIPLCMGALLIGYMAMPKVLAAQSEEVIRIARVYMLVVFHLSFGSIYVWVAQGLQQFKYWNALRLFPTVLWLIAIVCGYVFDILSPVYLVAFMLLVPTLSIPVFTKIMWRSLNGPASLSVNQAKELLTFGVPLAVSSLPQVLNFRLDQLLLAAYLDPVLLGMYVVGVAWGGIMTSLLSSIGSVIFPSIAALNNVENQRQMLGVTTRSSIMVAIPVAFLNFFLTPILVPLLFGEPFRDAVPSALVLVAAGAFANLNTVWRDIVNGLGQPKQILYAELVGIIFTVTGLALLLPTYQLIGAAVATVLSYLASFIYMTFSIHRYTKMTLGEILIPSLVDVSLLWNRLLVMVKQPIQKHA